MKFFTSEKSLILVFCVLFALSALFLFWKNHRELDPNLNKNWWTLSFAAPEDSQNLTFTVENHTPQTNFHYQIIANNVILKEAALEIERGTSQTVTPETAPTSTRTSIIVTTGTEKKEIYR